MLMANPRLAHATWSASLSSRHVRFDAGGGRNIGEAVAKTETVDGVSDSLVDSSIWSQFDISKT